MTVDLARWLGAQLDEDERIARAAAAMTFGTRWLWDNDRGLVDESDTGVVERVQFSIGPHIAAHDPARVLRDVDGRRRTLIRCQEEMLSGIPRLAHFAKQTLREMALSYEHRPGYAEAVASVD